MAELERPRPREKQRAKQANAHDEDQQFENRLNDLKEYFQEQQVENSTNQEDNHSPNEETVTTNEDSTNLIESNEETKTITDEHPTTTSPETITDNTNEILQDTSTLNSSKEQIDDCENNQTSGENSAFLYPRLSLSLWSPATAPLPSFDIEANKTANDPYSIENFKPAELQCELRQTFLPFINIADEHFLSEHESFIANNPQQRSLITKDENEMNNPNDDDDYDEFNSLISSFYDIRIKADQLNNDYDILERKIASLLPHVWSFSSEKIESGAYCGDNVYLKRSIIYEQANFDRNLATEVSDTLRKLRTIIYQQYVPLLYQTLWHQMKINSYVYNLIKSNRTTKTLLHAIEILFKFQRYRTRDDLFYNYTRQLLKHTIDVVYKSGNYNETLFIISHVLRCPPGINKWATNFVRLLLPASFEALCAPSHIRYIAHFLATLLFPIKNRDIFLQNWIGENGETVPSLTSSNLAKHNQQWMLIDADGHERAALLRWDTLNEDDLIALLNQFNLNYLMQILFHLNSQSDDSNRKYMTYENVLRILAILDLFVEILCRGFDTYADSQYKTFHKHIGKMIRDSVHVCRYYVDIVLQHLNTDEKIRLRDHYFAYIYRSVENIIRQCRNVRWSLLSLFALFDLPSSLQSRLLHLICSIPDNESVTVETSTAIDQMLNSATAIEVLSLLKVLHNLGQTADESFQISNVIFYITCLHPVSREYSLRDGRSILAHFATLRPSVISHLLKLASVHIDSVGNVLFGLFHSLPMDIWMPNDSDLSIIENWFNDISQSTIRFELALYLIDIMNWQELPDKQQLCIPYSVHCEVALILLKLHLKYCDKMASTKENQIQMQNFTKKTQINLDQWIWKAVLRLQLNQSCLSIDSFVASMNQEQIITTNNVTANVPTVDGMSDEIISEIRRAIDQYHNPIAYYISFGLDQPGASAAGFFEKGIEYFSQLVQNGKYSAAIRILHDMSAILVRSVDYLIEHVPFTTALKTLLNTSDASISLLKSASSYIMQQRSYDETTNAKILTSSILDLLIWLEDDSKFRRLVLLFWFKLLTGLKDWNKDSSTLFILDNILAHSFVHDVKTKEVIDHLFQIAVSALNPRQNPQATRTGFLSWIPLPSAVTSTQTYWSSLSIDSSLLSRYPIVSYYFLNAENSFEIDQNVLVELKAELDSNPNGKVDQIWRKLIQQRHYPYIPLTSLSIYRWGTMASEMPITHPLLPLVWENFFTIYLSKRDNCLHGVGYRLFESPAHITFLKQMKRSLIQASEHYASSTTDSIYASRLSKLYHALSLWIDEPRLHDPQLNVLSLPQQYDNERLSHLFNVQYQLFDVQWFDLVDIGQMYDKLVKFTNELGTKKRTNHENNRTTNNNNNNNSGNSNPSRSVMTSLEKLIDLVSNVQRPNANTKSNQNASIEKLIIPKEQILPNNYDEIKELFEKELKKIIRWLELHCQRFDRQVHLDETLMSLLPLLWKNEFQEQSIQASCQNVLNPVHQCTRPAYIIVRYKTKQKCSNSHQRCDVTVNEHKQLLTSACSSCDIEICRSVDLVTKIVQHMTQDLSSPFLKQNQSLNIIDTGAQLFYLLLSVYDEKYTEYMQPLSEQLNTLYDRLGEIFIKPNNRQPQTILEYVVHDRPNISSLISYFNPNSLTQSDKFIDIYNKLSKMFTCNEHTTYILQMFRKFKVKEWFENGTNSNQHLKFIETLFNHFRSLIENYSLTVKIDKTNNANDSLMIEQTSQLFDISIGHMIQILNYSYPSQIGYLFRHLIENIQLMRKKQKLIQQQNNSLIPLEFQQSIERGLLPTKVLSEFLDQLHFLENTSSIKLGKQQIDEMIQWLHKFVLQQIEQQNEKCLVQLYQSWRPCLNELTRIYSILLILNIQKHRHFQDQNMSKVFEQILLLYAPFIDPTCPSYSLTEWKTIIDHHGDMLTRMIKTFSQIYEELIEYIDESYNHKQEFFQSVFQYWYKIVKYLITNEYAHPILDIYHRYLTNLSWSNFPLNIECLLIFDELINANNNEKTPSTSLFEFIIHILSSIDIHSWMIDNDERLIQTLVPTHFHLLIQIFLSPQSKYSQNNDNLSRLSSQCELINWTYLDFDVYNDCMNLIMSKLEKDFILSPRASIDGYLNRILRCACEFNSLSIYTDRIRLKRLSYIRLIEQCLINAKDRHHEDEYRLTITNLLNDIESLSIQGRLQLNDELDDIFIELIRFININSFGQTILNSYQNYILDWIRQSQNSVTMLPLFISVCRTLKDRQRKILFIELILNVYFTYNKESKWSTIFNLFLTNEDISNFKVDDSIKLCYEYNASLTLYLLSEYELHSKKNSDSADTLDHEYRHLENLIEMLTDGKIRIIHGEEERILLLIIKINRIIIHQLQYGKSTDPLLTRLIRNYSNWLIALGTDIKESAYADIFAIIGIGKKAQYSFRFRLFVKLLGVMQLQHLTDEPCKIRVDSDDRRPDISSATNALLKQNLTNIASAISSTNSEYNSFKSQLIHCNSEYLQRTDVTFFHIANLIHYLCTHLFADLRYLTDVSDCN